MMKFSLMMTEIMLLLDGSKLFWMMEYYELAHQIHYLIICTLYIKYRLLIFFTLQRWMMSKGGETWIKMHL